MDLRNGYESVAVNLFDAMFEKALDALVAELNMLRVGKTVRKLKHEHTR